MLIRRASAVWSSRMMIRHAPSILRGSDDHRTRSGSLESSSGRLLVGSGVLGRSGGCVVTLAAIIISGSVIHAVALVCRSLTLPL